MLTTYLYEMFEIFIEDTFILEYLTNISAVVLVSSLFYLFISIFNLNPNTKNKFSKLLLVVVVTISVVFGVKYCFGLLDSYGINWEGLQCLSFF